MSDIPAPNSCTSTFTDIVFLLFPKRVTLESLTRGQGRATGNNTGTKTWLPLERREQRSHSGHDNCLLNYIKPQCCPHAAGMSPLTQRNFIALPSHCPGDTGGTKAAVTPTGHLLDSPPRRTLWAWHNFPVRRHASLCCRVFVSRNKAWRRKEKNNLDSCSGMLSLHPFILQAEVFIVGRRR